QFRRSLPKQIRLQSGPFAEKGADGNLYIDFNWYLFLYNIGQQLFPSGSSGSGGSPILPADLIARIALDAAGADVPQAYHQIANAAIVESLGEDLAGADIAQFARQLANMQMLLPDTDVGPSLRDLANTLLLATDGLLPDPPFAAQPAQTVTVGASP
ncbi:hypothetical protein NO135_20015, partial [Clostridioides difficile]|nr:hypothetical protein [Clostridioides difficile]